MMALQRRRELCILRDYFISGSDKISYVRRCLLLGHILGKNSSSSVKRGPFRQNTLGDGSDMISFLRRCLLLGHKGHAIFDILTQNLINFGYLSDIMTKYQRMVGEKAYFQSFFQAKMKKTAIFWIEKCRF